MARLLWVFVVVYSIALHLEAQSATTAASGTQSLSLKSNAPTFRLLRTNNSASRSKELAWDAEAKQYVCKAGEMIARFYFSVTNLTDHNVIITGTETTCDCTTATLPTQPWVLAPLTNGQIQVTVDLTKKVGTVRNGVVILISNAPPQTLTVEATANVKIPPPPTVPNVRRGK